MELLGLDDAIAFVHKDPPVAETSAILLYRGARLEAPETVFAGEEGLPDGSCSPVERVAVAGTRSIVAEQSVVCAGHDAFALPRAVVVVSADRAGLRKKVTAKVVDPPGARRLALAITAPDRDGDGIDDLVVRVSLEAQSASDKPIALTVSFLDRPAGLSRDADEPEASIRAIAQLAESRAGPTASQRAPKRTQPGPRADKAGVTAQSSPARNRAAYGWWSAGGELSLRHRGSQHRRRRCPGPAPPRADRYIQVEENDL